MDTDLDALAAALYVTVDDLLKRHPEQVPPRPPGGFAPRISDAELVTLAVMAADEAGIPLVVPRTNGGWR